jgi:uncharacterized protein
MDQSSIYDTKIIRSQHIPSYNSRRLKPLLYHLSLQPPISAATISATTIRAIAIALPLLTTDTIAQLTFWDKTSGTWINFATVLIGTTIGQTLQGAMPRSMQQVITQGLGLFTLFLGVTMAQSLLTIKIGPISGIILGLIAITLGGILGEQLHLERRLHQCGDWLKRQFKGGGRFTEGFVAASLLFCIGPMAILGCLNNGLSGKQDLLVIKAVMDGIASVALTSTYGIGVGFSALMILLYQGSISLLAGFFAQVLPDPTTDSSVLMISGVGGLMVLGIGLQLLEVTQLRLASFLPALLVAPILVIIANHLIA